MSTAESLGLNRIDEPPEGPKFYDQTWDLAYRHALGGTASRFLGGLAEGRLYGRLCPQCLRTLVPARSFCDRCHAETTDWVEVSNRGVIEMFTIVYEPFRGLPEPPYALAYVTPDGADTALVGYVRGVDLSDEQLAVEALRIGTRARIVFSETPLGSVTDYWFEIDAESLSQLS
ncbi:MAG: hypothetical protein JW395_1506 [Nitrospira sp.]|nr:hypothetical protein [Nitrospira sp.]